MSQLLFSWLLCPLDSIVVGIFCFLFEYIRTSGTKDDPGSYCVFPASVLEPVVSIRIAFLYWKMELEAKISILIVFIATRVSFHLGLHILVQKKEKKKKFPSPVVEETILSTLYCIGYFIKDYLNILVCICFWALHSVPLFFVCLFCCLHCLLFCQ